MPLTGNISHDIKIERAAGKPEKQAIAISENVHRSDEKPVSERMDSLLDQINSLGSGAKRIAQRMDAGLSKWTVVVEREGKKLTLSSMATNPEDAKRFALESQGDDVAGKAWKTVSITKVAK